MCSKAAAAPLSPSPVQDVVMQLAAAAGGAAAAPRSLEANLNKRGAGGNAKRKQPAAQIIITPHIGLKVFKPAVPDAPERECT